MAEKGNPLTLDPYQWDGLAWLWEKKISGLFAGMGTGKTPITLAWMDTLLALGHAKGVLVVAPLRVGLITWPAQIERFFPWMVVADMRTPEGRQHWEDRSAHVYIINFEMMATREVNVPCPACKANRSAEASIMGVDMIEVLVPCDHCKHPKTGQPTGQVLRKDLGFVAKFLKPAKYRRNRPVNAIVIDELSMLKDYSSKRAQALRAWLPEWFPEYRTALTGTPMENGYMDLFSEIWMLDGGKRLGTSITAYREAYFTRPHPNSFKWVLKPGAKEEINALLADLCLVIRAEDHLGIPETRVEDVMCPMPKEAWAKYKVLEKELLVKLETGEITALSAAALSTKLLQFTAGMVYDVKKTVHKVHGHKVAELRKLRKKHAGEPLLVLTAYQHEMENVLMEFPEARKFHEKDLPAWQRGEIPMWVANPASLSHGIDGLQVSGRIAIWMTLPYGGKYNQTNARLARRGQERETIVYRLLVPMSIDEAVVEILDQKDEDQNGLMASVKALQKLAKAR